MNLVTPAMSGSDLARRHLEDCRQHLERGDASSAMHCLLQAVCHNGGTTGASDAQQLRATFLERVKTMDDIHSLLSRLTLASSEPQCRETDGMSAAPSTASSISSNMNNISQIPASRSINPCIDHVDSSSFRCPYCGGVFARERQDQHFRLWCPALRHGLQNGPDYINDSGSDMDT